MAEPTVRCGLDIGKKNFAVFGVNQAGRTSIKRQLTRSEVSSFFCQLPPCEIGIESCGGSHYWARELEKLGHRVRLISAKYVKPYLRKGKNDSNDAEAICEAISRPNMKFVSVKTEAQQSILMAHRIRSQCIATRISIINQIHGHLLEFGIVVSKAKSRFRRDIQDVFAGAELPVLVEELLHGLLISLDHAEERIAVLDRRMRQWAQQDELASKLLMLDGVGALTASAAVATAGDPSVFKNGRHFAAWLGLVPRQYSTGGKYRVGGEEEGAEEREQQHLEEHGRGDAVRSNPDPAGAGGNTRRRRAVVRVPGRRRERVHDRRRVRRRRRRHRHPLVLPGQPRGKIRPRSTGPPKAAPCASHSCPTAASHTAVARASTSAISAAS